MNVAKGLRLRKHEVKIITPRPTGYQGEVPEDYILLGTSRRLNGALATAGDIAAEVDGDEIDKVLEREKFDVINFHEPWVPMLARQIVGRSKKAAHVATFHANLAESTTAKGIINLFKPYGREIGNKMHVLTATSPASAHVLLTKSAGELEDQLVNNLRYIPCAVDLSFFRPIKHRQPLSGEGTQSIVYIGRPDKRKGVDWLLKAFAELVVEMPNTHLIVAGDGSRQDKLKQYVKSQKIPNVSFPGFVSEEEKRRLLGNADVACFPSLYGEGFGIVLVEAMAMGVPVVAGNNLGYRGVMKNEGRIGLVDPEATSDFANRLAAFLQNEPLRRMLSDWGLREVPKYDYVKIVTQYEDAYYEALRIFNQQLPQELKDASQPQKARRRFTFRRHAR